jgi:hypothetical protein
MSRKLFISYSHEDKSVAKQEAEALSPAASVNILELRRRICDGVDRTHKPSSGWCARAT